MAGPLTYPPEILIKGTAELPAAFTRESANEEWIEAMAVELIILVIEFVIELPFHV